MFKNAWYKSEWFIRFNLFMCLGEENNYPPPQKKPQLINWNKHHPLQILVLKDRFDQEEAENVDRRCLHKDRQLVITNVCYLGNTRVFKCSVLNYHFLTMI